MCKGCAAFRARGKSSEKTKTTDNTVFGPIAVSQGGVGVAVLRPDRIETWAGGRGRKKGKEEKGDGEVGREGKGGTHKMQHHQPWKSVLGWSARRHRSESAQEEPAKKST